jgi:hypothetical protein
MSERPDDLGARLRAVAEHGAVAGRPSPAAAVRARGDHRRRRARVVSVAAAAAVAGVIATAVVYARPDTAAPPISPASPTVTAPGLPAAFMVQAVDRPEESVFTVTASGRIGTYPGGADTGEREVFTLSPRADGTTYQLKTAYLRSGDQPLCVGVQGTDLWTMACDSTDPDQIVQLIPPASPTFDLVIGGHTVEVDQLGNVSLVPRGNTAAQTSFRLLPWTTGTD